MQADITTIPDSELQQDRAASLLDILLIERLNHPDSERYAERLRVNREIVGIIDAEIERRATTQREA